MIRWHERVERETDRMSRVFNNACPVPAAPATVTLAHGGGGRVMHDLLEKLILPAFQNEPLSARHDGAVLNLDGRRVAFTTDSYVVTPHVFPGGDLGSLAVHGTINDLAMCGARPLALSAALILEEGFPLKALRELIQSMSAAAAAADVPIVTGDTKVVHHGNADGAFINTAGLGIIEHELTLLPSGIRDGDAVIVSGDLGRHGIAVMSAREGLRFETSITSDSAPLWTVVRDLLDAGIELHCLRDLTRGGLASALVEIAEAARLSIRVDEAHIPVLDAVQGACELLGLDPLYVACEGRFIAFLDYVHAARAVDIMRAHPVAEGACVIGAVAAERPGHVVGTTSLGTSRLIDMFSGEQLPRIC